MDNFTIIGGKKLSGSIQVNSSKNAAIALLVGSLMNKGRTTLHNVPDIEEVKRVVEVLKSIGVTIEIDGRSYTITTPKTLTLKNLDVQAAHKTRIIILFLGALSGRLSSYKIPQSGGCRLGSRTIAPHLYALEDLGVVAKDQADSLVVSVKKKKNNDHVVLYEQGDTVTENALFAAAQRPGKTIIRFASANYMVQDVCFFLQELGVHISGVGTTTLEVDGLESIEKDVEYTISEDPIEAMMFVSIALTTKSSFTIERAPIEFLEKELEILRRMGAIIEKGSEYISTNGKTRLVDLIVKKHELTALPDKIHPLPFPGLNIDNLPFFIPIAMVAQGRTLIHDWVFENRLVHTLEINRVADCISLLDPHRLYVSGPVTPQPSQVICPPALRPSAIVMVAMLAAKGTSVLQNVYPILRGYERLPERLSELGAEIRYEKA
jgi:UDP-N-acetylglucosamine 1-carboxyvinyltransferase